MAPWAAIVIGLVAGAIAVTGVLWVERIGIDDPIGAVAVHGLAGVWGTLATGLDVAEHGMWGYPEFYIPVPGGYGTESHRHLLGHGHAHPLRPAAPEAAA